MPFDMDFDFSAPSASSVTYPNALNVVIQKRMLTESAPDAIIFDADNVMSVFGLTPSGTDYDPTMHQIRYIVDFGDPGTTFEAPSLYTAWKNRNIAYTRRCGHVYRQLGTYTVEFWAVNLANGETATGTITFTVGDYANETNYRAVTIGVGKDYATWVAAMVADANETDPTHYIVDPGHTETSSGGVTLRYRGHIKMSVAPGAGARPVIQLGKGVGRAGIYMRGTVTEEFRFSGIHFKSDYDSTDNSHGYPVTEGPAHIFNAVLNSDLTSGFGRFLLDDCELSNCNSPVQFDMGQSNNLADIMFTAHDCYFHNWMNYGLYLEGCDTLILGDKFANPSAVTSGWGRDTIINRLHGPIRTASARNFIVDAVEFRSLSGWFGNGPIPGQGSGNVSTQQACIRYNQSQSVGAQAFLTRLFCEGGVEIFDLTPTNSGDTIVENNVFMSMIYGGGSFHNNAMIRLPYGGLTLENSIWVATSALRYSGDFHPRGMVEFRSGYNDQGNADVQANPINILNCQVIDLYSGSTATLTSSSLDGNEDVRPFNNVVEVNPTAGTHDLTQDFMATFLGYSAPNAITSSPSNYEIIDPRLTEYATPQEFLRYEKITKTAATGTIPHWNMLGEVRASGTGEGAW